MYREVIAQRGDQSVAAITSSLVSDDVGVPSASDFPVLSSNPLYF